jgi:hypothetical protein
LSKGKLKILTRSGLKILAAALLCALVSMGISIGAAHAAYTKDARVKEAEKIADELKRAILAQDIKHILHYVDKGIYCVDSLIEMKQVEKDLRDPQSKLFVRLFGPAGMREYFQKAKDQNTRVDFMVVNGKEDLNSFCLRYMSSNYAEQDWPEICLGFREGKWSVNNSLYDCL